jgi:hypothetical protein
VCVVSRHAVQDRKSKNSDGRPGYEGKAGADECLDEAELVP